jgi:hypothetical protein
MNNNINYFKIGKATDLAGRDRKIYRLLEIFPGFFSWATLIVLAVLSYFDPTAVAYFLIAFDVYWLLLVIYLGIHLVASYRQMQANLKVNWRQKCAELAGWEDIIHIVIFPIYKEPENIVRPSIEALIQDGYPTKKIIVVLAVEERGGREVQTMAEMFQQEYGGLFREFLVTVHPDNIEGELKGKGANQAWAARIIKAELVDREGLDYQKIMVSVFDSDTIIRPGYFSRLTYLFLTVEQPHQASYQPIPVYHNNVWQAPFFARVAASSNTFWQMMQQIRQEKLATYSSHSMSWQALVDIGFWSVNMVSEDSRIFWHCYCYYKGDYRVEPMYFPVSMDVTMDKTAWQTAKNLYKQQRRWGWGVENLPYLMFNFWKIRKQVPKKEFCGKIFVQLHGFHSWATNALIIAVIGWLPILIGGDRFNSTVISSNLPGITRTLMTFAMMGLILSAIISTLLLPPRPKKYRIGRSIMMVLQWAVLPVSIIVFGSIPGLEAQTRLMLGKYMGFWVTPKER